MNYFFSPQYIVLFDFVFFQGRGNDFCLELSKFKVPKMLDLQTKSSMILFQSYLLVQATNLQSEFHIEKPILTF
jgi:hypothetical protein